MARSRTLGDLRDEVRGRADIENSQHVTDAEINRFVNQSGAALHAMCVETCEDYFVTTYTTTAPAAVDGTTYLESLVDTTFYKVVAVECTINSRNVKLGRWTWAAHARLTDPASAGGTPLYRILVEGFVIAPAIPEGTEIRIYFVPPFADMDIDGDSLDGRDGWEEWIVLDAAIKCMTKEESDPSALMAERDRVWSRIKVQMTSRDMDEPSVVQETENSDYRNGWPFRGYGY